MVGFGYKQAWLAVRDGDPDALLAALGLRDLGPVSWLAGVDLAYQTDDRLVLTPPVPGAGGARWLLAAGQWLILGAKIDTAVLSAALGTEVQRFATHRTVDLHHWERAAGGRLVREFEYLGDSGEVTRWRGEPDPVEREIGLPAGPPDDTDDIDADDILVGEDDVMRVAAAWSVDPTALVGPAPGPLRAAAA
jgi:hypothetical protein